MGSIAEEEAEANRSPPGGEPGRSDPESGQGGNLSPREITDNLERWFREQHKARRQEQQEREDALLRRRFPQTNWKAPRPSPEWLIEPFIVRHSNAVLYGPWGIGKSYLAWDWSLRLAQRKCHACYIYSDNSADLALRREAWELRHGKVSDDFFHVYEFAVNMHDKDAIDALADKFVTDCRGNYGEPELIVIDTVAKNFGPDRNMNDNDDMSDFTDGMSRLRAPFSLASCLALHHPGKDIGKGMLGGDQFGAGVETVMKLTGKQHGTLNLTWEKHKLAGLALPKLQKLRLVTSGSSCVPEYLSATAEPVKPNANLNALLEVLGDGLRHTDLKAAWRTKTGLSKSAFDDTLNDGKASGKIEKNEEGIYVPVVRQSPTGLKTDRARPPVVR